MEIKFADGGNEVDFLNAMHTLCIRIKTKALVDRDPEEFDVVVVSGGYGEDSFPALFFKRWINDEVQVGDNPVESISTDLIQEIEVY